MDRREHRRAKLSLPVRLRWANPFGQKTEICETLDVSRGGLLVPCKEAHHPGVPLWVTFPYDASLGDGQPEVFAKVVHIADKQAGALKRGPRNAPAAASNGVAAAVGLHFESNSSGRSNGARHQGEREMRGSERRTLSVPIRVRVQNVPWFEEAMTINVSLGGLCFLSSREYDRGEHLVISFEPTGSLPRTGPAEFRAEVVRVAQAAVNPALAVAVRRLS